MNKITYNFFFKIAIEIKFSYLHNENTSFNIGLVR